MSPSATWLWGLAALTVGALVLTGDTAIPDRFALLRGLHPKAQQRFLTLLLTIERKTGWTVVLTSGYRSFAEQALLHLKNAANAAAGRSGHNYGLGIDLNLTKNGVWLRKADAKTTWEASGAPAVIRRLGFVWGGDYASYHDPVHVDDTRRNPVARLYAQALAAVGNNLALLPAFNGRTVRLLA